MRRWHWPWERGSQGQPEPEAGERAAPAENPSGVSAEPLDSGGAEAVHAVVQAVHQECSSQPDDHPAASEVPRNTGRCLTCPRPDVEIIHAKRRKGQTLRSISSEHGIPLSSLFRHFKHIGSSDDDDSNTEQVPISENWRNGGTGGTDGPPEGADALLWELGQLRKVAQRTLARAEKTRNLRATASLLRAANGLLGLFARIEKAKAEGLKTQQAVAALPPQAVREELNRKLDALAERLRQAQAAAPKCLRCGQALSHGVQVEGEEPKPAGPGGH